MTLAFRDEQRRMWRRRTWGCALASLAFNGLSVGSSTVARIRRCADGATNIAEKMWPLAILGAVPAVATTVCVLQLTRFSTPRRSHLVAAALPLTVLATTMLVAWEVMRGRPGLPCLD